MRTLASAMASVRATCPEKSVLSMRAITLLADRQVSRSHRLERLAWKSHDTEIDVERRDPVFGRVLRAHQRVDVCEIQGNVRQSVCQAGPRLAQGLTASCCRPNRKRVRCRVELEVEHGGVVGHHACNRAGLEHAIEHRFEAADRKHVSVEGDQHVGVWRGPKHVIGLRPVAVLRELRVRGPGDFHVLEVLVPCRNRVGTTIAADEHVHRWPPVRPGEGAQARAQRSNLRVERVGRARGDEKGDGSHAINGSG